MKIDALHASNSQKSKGLAEAVEKLVMPMTSSGYNVSSGYKK